MAKKSRAAARKGTSTAKAKGAKRASATRAKKSSSSASSKSKTAKKRSRAAAAKAAKTGRGSKGAATTARKSGVKPVKSAKKSVRGAAAKSAAPKRSAVKKSAAKAAEKKAAPKAPRTVTPRALAAGDVEEFRAALLAKRAQIMGDVTAMADEAFSRNRQDASGNLSSMPIHMADLGTDNYEQEFTLGLLEGERALLNEINEALLRIERGTYGICLATGKPIGKARLRATPWTKYCYEYVIEQERRQMRRF